MRPNTVIYTGGYNNPSDSSKQKGGICCFRWNKATHRLESIGLESQCRNPSFLAFHPNGHYLYAANELDTCACITAHRILPNGCLAFMNQAEASGGGMCHLCINTEGTVVYGADYASGNIVAFQINPDGTLGSLLSNLQHIGRSIHPRQDHARVHQVLLSPDGTRLIAVDFGSDALFTYTLNPSGAIDQASCVKSMLPAGEGPRHLAFHRNGRTAYVLTELGNKIFPCDYASYTGVFSFHNPVLLTDSGNASISAEIAFSNDYQYLYASVRGADELIVLKADPEDGSLIIHDRSESFGREPRMFSINKDDAFLLIANQGSNSVSLLRIEKDSGHIAALLDTVPVPGASFAAFHPLPDPS